MAERNMNNVGSVNNDPIYTVLSADEGVTEIESLCVNCEENGITRLLLTKIPFYKEIILASFNCPHCNYSNNEIQPGGRIQEKGVVFTLRVESLSDLNRQVVKSDTASFKIPHLEFEIPPKTQKGEITTLEGVLERVITNLQKEQPLRKIMDEEAAHKIDQFLQKLQKLKLVESPFDIELDDCSGNSFIENPHMPNQDPQLTSKWYVRSYEQDQLLGIYSDHDPTQDMDFKEEVHQFATNCSNCNAPCSTNMKVTKIPHFKEVIIMATTCEACGHRTNEVKSGAGVEDKGVRIELRITRPEDLCRDVLKSETCSLSIPELEFEAGAETLSGKFSTIEGLLDDCIKQLNSDAVLGDSADPRFKDKMRQFTQQLENVKLMKKQVHFVMDDPAGNSYLQNLYSPEEDPEMKITHYERSFDQNEDLGLNDMKTENYENNVDR